MSGKVRVGVLISGRGTNMSALISAAQAPDYPAQIVLVLSDKDSAAGLEAARAAGVPARAIPSKPFAADRQTHERAMDAALRDADVEVVALAGYMRLLTPWFVAAWRGRMLNIHPSLLPLYPGLHTHARALEAGDAEAGCTVHLVTDDMDAGPILAQARVPVVAGDDEETLAARVLQAEHGLYPQALAAFCRSL
jgi:phosphoribosylglycinamide formyltransferase-1/phosphoribosylamine--glycine ligase/phosphoribosylglycinamide formyltransferase/phosphoribosylformylglycinamidine cyclo-ligase